MTSVKRISLQHVMVQAKRRLFTLGYLLAATLTVSNRSQAAKVGDLGRIETIAVAGLVSSAQQTDTLGLGREDHRALILERLQQAGWSAVDAKSNADPSLSRPARFVLGGSINEINCSFDNLLQCSVAIRWEVKDLASDATVYRVTTRARESGQDSSTVGPMLIASALRSLTTRPRFAESLRAPANDSSSATSSPMADANFRECARAAVNMPEASQAILSSTVLIESGNALGSGSILSPDGFVLTAAHVIEPGQPLHVQLSSGPVYEAQLIRWDVKRDVALLRAKGTPLKQCLPLRHDEINVGEEVYAIGSPLSKELSFSLTRGIVSGFRTIEGVPLVQTDASVNPGNSGGPLVDKKGRLLAVVDFKITGQVVQGLAFAVTLPAALNALHLHAAANSDAALSVPLVVSPAAAKTPTPGVDDVDDPAQPGDYASAVETHRPSATASALRIIGGTAITLGLVGVGTSWLVYEAGKTNMSRSTFNSLLTVNDISWAAVGVGAGSYALSFLIPSGSGPKRTTGSRRPAQVYAGIGPGSILIGGEL